jgi:segregation and condensation protein B
MKENDEQPEETRGAEGRLEAEGVREPAWVRQGLPDNVAMLPSADRRERLRILEALIFAASEPVDVRYLQRHLGADADVEALLAELSQSYAGRGVNLVKVSGKWVFRTAQDLAPVLEEQRTEQRRLSKAALETLAVIAYHQPVTRAEIEDVRGVTTSRGTLDVLMETGWVRPRGRRRAPGKPVTYGTTEQFLVHFGLDNVSDLPGLQELKGAGLLQSNLPPDFVVPSPVDVAALMPDELPLDDDADQEELALEMDDASGEGDDVDAGGAFTEGEEPEADSGKGAVPGADGS